ncbi:MAG: xanthine dehydrogenase family protein subunit M [Tepidisphaeraceae bacterium]|jgi:xanthine dehydrogenase YagS FAD-binding subunit
MKAFEWSAASSVEDAVKLLAAVAADDPDESPRPLAGGQDLLTTMKDRITRPKRVVNLKTIPGLDRIQFDPAGNAKIGALVTLHQLESDAQIRANFPGLAEAARSVATIQIRNLGTVAGNLCQRPRCWYFRLENVICLKKGGSQCYAATGENKYNAIFGGGPSYIVHPSDLAPMLLALGATLSITGPNGNRQLPLEKFFTTPRGGDLTKENVLADAEIITEIQIPDSPLANRSTYLKFKERSSLDFAMSAVAAAVELAPDRAVRQARLVLGGVAPIPWRVPKAEAALIGNPLDDRAASAAAEIALAGAAPLAQNAYKIPLTKALIKRALTQLKS